MPKRRCSVPPLHRSGADIRQFVQDKPAEAVQGMETMLQLLVEARLRIQQLESELEPDFRIRVGFPSHSATGSASTATVLFELEGVLAEEDPSAFVVGADRLEA